MGKLIAWAVSSCFIAWCAYVSVLLVWFGGLWVASIFGYETPHDRNEALQRRAFFRIQQDAFCQTQRIPPAYCDQIWRDSAALDAAVTAWVQIKIAKDKEIREGAPLWGLFLPFTEPFEGG